MNRTRNTGTPKTAAGGAAHELEGRKAPSFELPDASGATQWPRRHPRPAAVGVRRKARGRPTTVFAVASQVPPAPESALPRRNPAGRRKLRSRVPDRKPAPRGSPAQGRGMPRHRARRTFPACRTQPRHRPRTGHGSVRGCVLPIPRRARAAPQPSQLLPPVQPAATMVIRDSARRGRRTPRRRGRLPQRRATLVPGASARPSP